MKAIVFVALIVVALSPGCALPFNQTRQSRDYFTIGSTMDDVASLMGTPSVINNIGLDDVLWFYGSSSVTFHQGRVSEWSNYGNNLKIRWSASTPIATAPDAAQPRPVPSAPESPVARLASQSPDARQIDAQVAAILAGEHNAFPPPKQVRSDPSAQVVEIETKNNTPYVLTVLYSGPTSRRAMFQPQETQTIVLAVGKYQVAATVDSPTVLPFAGKRDILGGGYESTFYIESVAK